MEILYNQPIVVDNGSGNLKAGFAGDDKPRTYGSAVIGRPKYRKFMAGSLLPSSPGVDSSDDTFIGDAAQNNRGLLKLTYPMEHGIVKNWSDMERVWYHMFDRELKIRPEDHPLLLTEAPLNPKSNRDVMCQVMFEQFNVPCMYVSIQAVLALYASGRTTGAVVDSGDGVSHVVPVYEGFALPTSIKRMDIAGRDITTNLSFHIRRTSGVSLQSSAELEIVRLIKEQCCFVSKEPEKDEKVHGTLYARKTKAKNELFTTYTLPDGHEIHLGAEKFRAPEILFNPHLIGDESPGLHELVALAINKTDLDLRPHLYQNLLLSGGNTLLTNFGDRLLKELKSMQHNDDDEASSIWSKSRIEEPYSTKMKVKIYAPPERKYSTWIGGSILAGLSTFKKMWVTLEEYRDNPDIVHKKCL
ncbi:ARP1 [Candida theae]|uniref:Centractin n=1 Tax=Candida theae TaxID=1198502 RepID=A0AAD5BGK8_9ASCO|nr:ARP1 [Candida theae]KAI5961682.1 ARP1 [Candida theae]